MDGARARSAALQPVVFGQFPIRTGVFDMSGPGHRQVVGRIAGQKLKGVDELVTVFGRGEDVVA